jgi:hypothetical protein
MEGVLALPPSPSASKRMSSIKFGLVATTDRHGFPGLPTSAILAALGAIDGGGSPLARGLDRVGYATVHCWV